MTLEGFRVGVTSDRRSAELIDALERRGATVLHAPTMRIAPVDRDEAVLADTRAVVDASPDLFLVTTAYGLRRWLAVADEAGEGDSVRTALRAGEILVRGPKARGAVRGAGLDDVGASPDETTSTLVTIALERLERSSTVAVQLHGHHDADQLARLRGAGHRVLTVAPYRWLPPQDPEQVTRLLDAAVARSLDALTFTSAPASEALLAAARGQGIHDAVVDALRTDVLAAAVGPVTAAPLQEAGIDALQPDRYRLGALVRHLATHLERRGPR